MLTQPLTRQQQRAATTGYEDYSQLVHKQAAAYCAKYGGNLDEITIQAEEIFLEAYFAPMRETCPNFETHLKRWIWSGLLDYFRVQYNRNARYEDSSTLMLVCQPTAPTHDIRDLFSGDAAVVVGLICNPPADLEAAVTARGGQGRNWRSCLREWLSAPNYNWDNDRISAAFAAIKGIL